MIQSAEFQNTDTLTIPLEGSVTVKIAIEPSDLTISEASHILDKVGVDGVKNQEIIGVKDGYDNGIVTVRLTNLGLPKGSTIGIRCRLRYAPFPSDDYVDTSNGLQIIGGVAEG